MKQGAQFEPRRSLSLGKRKPSAPSTGARVHPKIAWAKLSALRDGAAIASKNLWS